MDVITLSKFGYPCVATLGTSVTEDQINNIFSLSEDAYLVFDGDEAGQKASLRVFEKNLPILKINKNFKFVFLPENMDPEDFINRYGENEFENLLDKAVTMLDLLWSEGAKLLKDNTPETNVMFWSFLRNKVNSIEDTNLKLAYRDEIEKRIKVYRQKSNFYKKAYPNNLQNKRYQILNQQKLPKTGVEIRFEAIIYIMLMYPSICITFDEKISLLDFKDQRLNEIKDVLLEIIFNRQEISSKELHSELINKGFAIQLRKIMQSNISSRLDLDKNYIEINHVHKILKELLDLINTNYVI